MGMTGRPGSTGSGSRGPCGKGCSTGEGVVVLVWVMSSSKSKRPATRVPRGQPRRRSAAGVKVMGVQG